MTETLIGPNLHEWVEEYGSPLNIINTAPLVRNIDELTATAQSRGIDFRVYFARKANKCLSFVDAAASCGTGIDVASLPELQQVVGSGITGSDVICTAAIKTNDLLAECVHNRVTIAIDNADEFQQLQPMTNGERPTSIALRVSGFDHEGNTLHSRFGIDIHQLLDFLAIHSQNFSDGLVTLDGLHFHLDGYSADQRISAIRQCLPLIDQLRSHGHDIRFLDIGGGIPMSYLDDETQWTAFQNAHREALLGRHTPITYRNHGLGFTVVNGEVHGRRNTYPYYQRPVQTDWLGRILDASYEESTIAKALADRALQLRSEPGRSVLDGCGMTVARVVFRKRHTSGDWFIGLAMNRTQCRTSSDDFLVDPLLIPHPTADRSNAMNGYLVGAYCTESELLSLRNLQFSEGVAIGDLVVFPNTAGYFMHFLESRSHQFPLAKNVSLDGTGDVTLDRIDR
ncbi:Y4yA family PLP-dependent enzyme [Thalassoroseus pseudoceratinae]|uniref:Y4yA family PLP-dependent enzyme n=1 Tax=Thalassoroseus pseudoceratinae TaxID=2713176 RepID=UPI00141F2990|nr:Y4yA family PLP-dependent enzyme [Thalassoroseus pseudoceratinae]